MVLISYEPLLKQTSLKYQNYLLTNVIIFSSFPCVYQNTSVDGRVGKRKNILIGVLTNVMNICTSL